MTAFGGKVNEATFRYSREYFTYISIGIPFYMFGQAMNPIIRSDGSPKFAMAATLAGAVTNLILDPIFIFLFHWGMMGAAVATVLGQALTAGLSAWYLFHTKAIRLEKSSFRLDHKLLSKVLSLGGCSYLAQISLVAAMAAIQNMVVKYGAQDAVFGQSQYAQIPMTVLGIVMKVFQIVISIVIGMAAGCIPIVGYNMGAGHKDRARRLFFHLLIAEAVVGAVAFVLVEGFPQQRITIFGAKNESAYYTEFAVRSFRVYLCMMVFACVKQGNVHLPAIAGKGLPINPAFHGSRSGIRRGIRFAVAHTFRTRWRALFNAGFGYPHVCAFLLCGPLHLQSAPCSITMAFKRRVR